MCVWRCCANHFDCTNHQLHLLQNAVFLKPPTSTPSEDQPPTTSDEVVRGLVELNVPSERRIEGIRVKLRAVQSVAILPDQRDMISFAGATPVSWEDSVIMEKVVEIGLPGSRSQVSITGNEAENERRGRSRAARSRNASRNATPTNSRPGSRSRLPSEGASNDNDSEHPETAGKPSHGLGGLGAAFARAISKSRTGSRTGSRAGSRNASPSRGRGGDRSQPNSGTNTAHQSPRVGPSRTSAESPHISPSQSTDALDVSRTSTVSSTTSSLPPPFEAVSSPRPSPTEEVESSILADTMSRTGLSHGRGESSVAHPHERDRDDMFGLFVNPRGRGGVGQSAVPSSATRSATMSPSRGFGRRHQDESRGRLLGPGGVNGVRAPSADVVGSSRFASSSSTSEDHGIELAKGVHGFEFAFILPADSPPYERSPFGRVRYLIKATALGAGRAKSNIEAWRDLFPVVNPAQDGGPTPLTVLYNDLHPTVGLLSVACTAHNISVGGVFTVDIHSPTPPVDLIVYLVRVSVETSTELRTKKKGKQHVPPQRHKLFEKGWVPPRPNDPHGPGDGKKSEGLIRDPRRPGARPDDAWTVQGIARMPNDNVVRSSTVTGTKASIRFTHQLLVEVVHSREPDVPGEDRKLKVFALRQPITLPSCCVALDAVTLPAYTVNDESTRPANMPYDIGLQRVGDAGAPRTLPPSSPWANTAVPQHGIQHDYCVCGQSLHDLSERERAMLPIQADLRNVPLDGLLHRKIGELPEREPSGFSALARSASRSSSRSGRSASSNRRSMSSISRSLSRVRSSSSSSASPRGRAPSLQRNTIGQGERGEGVIRSMSRGARASEIPGEAQGHHVDGVTSAPPAYHNVVEEEEEDGHQHGTTTTSTLVSEEDNNNDNNDNDDQSTEEESRGRRTTRVAS